MLTIPLKRARWVDRRLLLGVLVAMVFAVALACASDDDDTTTTAAPTATTVPDTGVVTVPDTGVVTVPDTGPVTVPDTGEVTAPDTGEAMESTLTFWNALAAGCQTRGGHLNLGDRTGEFSNLNPPTINQVRQFSITAEVLSGLVQLNPDLNPVPDLAESWSVSGDSLTYTFKLRENAKFHGGRTVTADDWIFTYDHQLDPATQSIHTKGLEGVNRPVKIDDFTLEISSVFPRASFLTKVVERASGRVMTLSNSEYIAEVGEGGMNRIPRGAGPFKVTSHSFGERLELEAARDTFYDPTIPCLDSVTHFNIPDDNVLVAALESRKVDMIWDFAPQFWDGLNDTAGVIVDTSPDVGFQMVAFNVRGDRGEKLGLETAAWDDINVVYAMGNALDRDKFIQRAFQGRAIPGYGPIPPGEKFYFRDLSGQSTRAFNPELAQKLIKEAGWEDGFTMTVLTSPQNKVPIEVLGALWKESLNITVIPDIAESSVEQPRRAAGNFEAWFGGSGGDPDPDDAIDDWFADGAKFNSWGYNDEEVNRLNRAQKSALDVNDRLAFILELSVQMDKTFHGTFTHHRINKNAYRDYVKGYVWIHALRQLEAVWLDQ